MVWSIPIQFLNQSILTIDGTPTVSAIPGECKPGSNVNKKGSLEVRRRVTISDIEFLFSSWVPSFAGSLRSVMVNVLTGEMGIREF